MKECYIYWEKKYQRLPMQMIAFSGSIAGGIFSASEQFLYFVILNVLAGFETATKTQRNGETNRRNRENIKNPKCGNWNGGNRFRAIFLRTGGLSRKLYDSIIYSIYSYIYIYSGPQIWNLFFLKPTVVVSCWLYKRFMGSSCLNFKTVVVRIRHNHQILGTCLGCLEWSRQLGVFFFSGTLGKNSPSKNLPIWCLDLFWWVRLYNSQECSFFEDVLFNWEAIVHMSYSTFFLNMKAFIYRLNWMLLLVWFYLA